MDLLKKTLLAGFLATLVMGTLFHFVYGWTENWVVAGFFVPVNESTWEHMKLLFFPMLLCSFPIKRILSARYPCVSSALSLGNLAGTFLIPVLFYTYTGVLGTNIMVLDLLTFFLSVLAAFYLVLRFTRSCRVQRWEAVLNSLMVILFFCFLLFTYMPPEIGLFQPPVPLCFS